MIYKAPAMSYKTRSRQMSTRSGYALRSDWPSRQATGRDRKTSLTSTRIYGRYMENSAERITPSNS